LAQRQFTAVAGWDYDTMLMKSQIGLPACAALPKQLGPLLLAHCPASHRPIGTQPCPGLFTKRSDLRGLR
jgi:hypothetical protein